MNVTCWSLYHKLQRTRFHWPSLCLAALAPPELETGSGSSDEEKTTSVDPAPSASAPTTRSLAPDLDLSSFAAFESLTRHQSTRPVSPPFNAHTARTPPALSPDPRNARQSLQQHHIDTRHQQQRIIRLPFRFTPLRSPPPGPPLPSSRPHLPPPPPPPSTQLTSSDMADLHLDDMEQMPMSRPVFAGVEAEATKEPLLLQLTVLVVKGGRAREQRRRRTSGTGGTRTVSTMPRT